MPPHEDVTTIIPSYNCPVYLPAAIQSAPFRTPKRILIAGDHILDNGFEVAEAWCKRSSGGNSDSYESSELERQRKCKSGRFQSRDTVCHEGGRR